MLKFHLVTDTHYYNMQALGFTERRDQVTLNESGPIIDAAFEQIIADKSTDILLIAGDLTNNGETVCHAGFIEKLRHLRESGIRVFPITATHDYGMKKRDESEESRRRTDVHSRDELFALYEEFGKEDIIARFELSYCAQLAPGYRLLALNDDDDENGLCGYAPRHLEWILEQIQKAREEAQFIFAMTHHPMLAPSPIYPIIGGDGNMVAEHERVTTLFADAGLHFVFTGHTHMHHINCKVTQQGNTFWDINTSALTGVPAPIRAVTVDDTHMHIRTEYVDHFAWDLQGKAVKQYLSDHFDKMLNSIFDAAGNDIDELINILAGEFSVNKDAMRKFKFPLKLFGKFINRATLGTVGRLLFCRIPKQAKRVKVRWLLVESVRNIYGGDQPYSPDTPIGAAVYAIMGRVDGLARPFLKKVSLPFESIQSFVMSLIYGETPDANADLPL